MQEIALVLLSTDFVVTVLALTAAVAGAACLLWLERRPRDPGNPRLVPTTPLLFLCLVVIIVVMAHLVTLLTGEPHRGRLG